MTPSTDLPEFFDTRAFATHIGAPVTTVELWRVRGGGPAFYRLPKGVRYRRRDVEQWLASRRVEAVTP